MTCSDIKSIIMTGLNLCLCAGFICVPASVDSLYLHTRKYNQAQKDSQKHEIEKRKPYYQTLTFTSLKAVALKCQPLFL
jgi:hypothetical protein